MKKIKKPLLFVFLLSCLILQVFEIKNASCGYLYLEYHKSETKIEEREIYFEKEEYNYTEYVSNPSDHFLIKVPCSTYLTGFRWIRRAYTNNSLVAAVYRCIDEDSCEAIGWINDGVSLWDTDGEMRYEEHSFVEWFYLDTSITYQNMFVIYLSCYNFQFLKFDDTYTENETRIVKQLNLEAPNTYRFTYYDEDVVAVQPMLVNSTYGSCFMEYKIEETFELNYTVESSADTYEIEYVNVTSKSNNYQTLFKDNEPKDESTYRTAYYNTTRQNAYINARQCDYMITTHHDVPPYYTKTNFKLPDDESVFEDITNVTIIVYLNLMHTDEIDYFNFSEPIVLTFTYDVYYVEYYVVGYEYDFYMFLHDFFPFLFIIVLGLFIGKIYGAEGSEWLLYFLYSLGYFSAAIDVSLSIAVILIGIIIIWRKRKSEKI